MEKISFTITKNDLFDSFFIKFPFWFPIIYIYLIFNFPSISNYLFILTLFLFAETHFASTWFFFFDKENWKWLKENSYNIFFIPIYVLILVFFIWLINPSLIIIFHYLASGWHVTRQSVGLLALYRVFNKMYKVLIYVISFFSLIIGLKNPGILSNLNTEHTNFFILIFFLIYLFIIFCSVTGKMNNKFQGILPMITGIFIYLPLLFFKNISVATAIGVGMHWCQYIAIIWSTYLRKCKANNKDLIFSESRILKFIFPRLSFVFIYAFLMTSFAFFGMRDLDPSEPEYSILFLIPLIFQLYHFYIDGFIWKFSDKHIKKTIKPYIYSRKV